jgi:glycine oxidase
LKQQSNNAPIENTLIVGSGLAGCLLAWRLQERGLPFQIVGSTTLPNAWSVAAGLINPVTGKWMTKSWNIDQLIPEVERTYRAIEQALDIEIYHPMPFRRYCQNMEDVKRCGRRSRNPRYANVLSEHVPVGSGPDALVDTHGSFEIYQASYVDLPILIAALQDHFQQCGRLRDETFVHAELERTPNGWHYKDSEAQRIIFCEGMGIQNNPWFNYLPISPAKGETLILTSDTLELPKTVYHHTKWLLPYKDRSFRIGATYDDNDLSHEPTESGKVELLKHARAFIKPEHKLEVQKHMAGIRPMTKDVRPFLGTHPNEAHLHILNGLGSKGASLAPEMTKQLLSHLFDGEPLDPEVDITRFMEQ